MSFVSMVRSRVVVAVVCVTATTLVLAGCSGGSGSKKALTVGTTDKITSIDPAGSYDNGSFAVMNQVYPFLLNSPSGSADVQPDIAESAQFTAPTTYTVHLKPNLKFANGHDLTSSDVKFTFDRQLKIQDANGPSSLLGNLESTEAPDPTTVVFSLKEANDQTFPHVLASPAGPIIDEQVFSATSVTPDADIVAGKAFAGQYSIASYEPNSLIQYTANSDYKGLLGPAKTATVNAKYYAESSNLKLDVQSGNIDVAFRSLSATDIDDLRKDAKVNVVDGPGGQTNNLVFNFKTQPYGVGEPNADPVKALAVRQAVADLIDRPAISLSVFKDTFSPLYGYVPAGIAGSTDTLKSVYGDGSGGPSVEKARGRLAAAGITDKVSLHIQYVSDHYGPSSGDEYALIKSQLEPVFTVAIQSTEWVQYQKDRVADGYPIYQIGWFPDFSDPDNYLTPFFGSSNFLKNHYDDPAVQALIAEQRDTVDRDKRDALIAEIGSKVANTLPMIPILQGSQEAVTGKSVTGAKDTLDASFKFRYGSLAKS